MRHFGHGHEWAGGPRSARPGDGGAGRAPRQADPAQLSAVLPPDLDAVFTSDAYGDELAARLRLAHVSVDRPDACSRSRARRHALDDIPFVRDGLRDGGHLRGWMTRRLRDVLAEQAAPDVAVSLVP